MKADGQVLLDSLWILFCSSIFILFYSVIVWSFRIAKPCPNNTCNDFRLLRQPVGRSNAYCFPCETFITKYGALFGEFFNVNLFPLFQLFYKGGKAYGIILRYNNFLRISSLDLNESAGFSKVVTVSMNNYQLID